VGRLHTNLLPHEIRLERMVRAKKPWAAAAAASLLLGVAGLGASLAIANSKYDNDQVRAAMKKSKDAVDKAQQLISRCSTIQKNIANKEKETQQMAAGQAEQLNWSLLLRYINEALPRPNGEKIPKGLYTEQAIYANKKLEAGISMTEEEQ